MYCAGAVFSASLTGIAAEILLWTSFSRASFVFSVVCERTVHVNMMQDLVSYIALLATSGQHASPARKHYKKTLHVNMHVLASYGLHVWYLNKN